MAKIIAALAAVLVASALSSARAAEKLTIVVPSRADPIERLAADELAGFLAKMYPSTRLTVAPRPRAGDDKVIWLGDRAELARFLGPDELRRPGSFLVRRIHQRPPRPAAIIAGADARATLHAVYALLEKLGCGFYLSYNRVPAFEGRQLDFAEFDIADAPLFGERIVFNWHNFLSSCSTWNLPDWKRWISQAARMRFSGVMVHAYGNNPMVCYTHKGRTKPIGYLSTTVKGRDWGTQHVNDVRRLHGGDRIFDGPVFGADAAMAEDADRAGAASRLMQQVFAFAAGRGLDVVFALDVDTPSSNPPEIITALPGEARLDSAGAALANPDTPAGYAFYKTQAETLLGDYPQIDKLILWYRSGGTPWRRLKPDDFPPDWRDRYQAVLAEVPKAGRLRDSPSMFAISRIVRAFRRALDEIGRSDVQLGIGTWHFGTLQAADIFMPAEVGFYPLDWSVIFDRAEVKALLASVGADRPVIPVVWAHHDDHRYIGRCYTPFADFASQLRQAGAAGFGIIHWTTRPLDIYFKSLARQVWDRTSNEPLETTCLDMAERTFGRELREQMGAYLLRWVTEAPQFGRETTDRFIDRPLDEPQRVIELCRARLRMLEAIEARAGAAASEWIEYYRLMEQFFIGFYRDQASLERSVKLLRQGRTDQARAAIEAAQPEAVIELYSKACRQGRISRGEKALVISLNLRWLPYFEAQRQALGLRPVRVDFAPTRHDPLAQGAGHRTFFVDLRRNFWLVLGQKETGAPAYTVAARTRPRDPNDEIGRSYIRADGKLNLRIKNIVGGDLAPGRYEVELILSNRKDMRSGEFDLTLAGGGNDPPKRRIRPAELPAAGPDKAILSIAENVQITRGHLGLEIEPGQAPVGLCGLVLRPGQDSP